MFLLQVLPSPDQAEAVQDHFFGYVILVLVAAVAGLFFFWNRESNAHKESLAQNNEKNLELQIKQIEVINKLTNAMSALTQSTESLRDAMKAGFSEQKEFLNTKFEVLSDKIDDIPSKLNKN